MTTPTTPGETKPLVLRIAAKTRAELFARAAERQTNVSTLVRQLILDYLSSPAESKTAAQPASAPSDAAPKPAAAPKNPRPVKYPKPLFIDPDIDYQHNPDLMSPAVWCWIFKGLGYTPDPVDQTKVAALYDLSEEFVRQCWHPITMSNLPDAEIPLHFVNGHMIRAHRGYEIMTQQERAIYEGRVEPLQDVDYGAAWINPRNYIAPPIKSRGGHTTTPEQVAKLDSLFGD